MINYFKKLMMLIIIFIMFYNNVFSEIYFKVSGKTTYKGVGISNIQILFQNPKIRYQQISKTDKNGDFFLYLQNGIYKVNIFIGNGYLSTNDNKTITVFNKNIVNVFFDLEKECSISGIVTL